MEVLWLVPAEEEPPSLSWVNRGEQFGKDDKQRGDDQDQRDDQSYHLDRIHRSSVAARLGYWPHAVHCLRPVQGARHRRDSVYK